jgi:hypothetical protein
MQYYRVKYEQYRKKHNLEQSQFGNEELPEASNDENQSDEEISQILDADFMVIAFDFDSLKFKDISNFKNQYIFLYRASTPKRTRYSKWTAPFSTKFCPRTKK